MDSSKETVQRSIPDCLQFIARLGIDPEANEPLEQLACLPPALASDTAPFQAKAAEDTEPSGPVRFSRRAAI